MVNLAYGEREDEPRREFNDALRVALPDTLACPEGRIAQVGFVTLEEYRNHVGERQFDLEIRQDASHCLQNIALGYLGWKAPGEARACLVQRACLD